MIIYTKADSALIIPCGLNTVVCPDTSHDLQMKTVNSSTVVQHVEPDAGYFGLYRVIVNPYELDSKTVDSSTEPQVITSSKDGLFEVIVNPYTLESKTQTITVNGEYTITPVTANGLSRVDISVNVADTPTVLQSKTADASTEIQVITPDEGYDGLSQVTVDPYTLESKSDTITENGLYAYYPSTADGLADVTIDVSVDTVNNQTKTVDSSTTIQYVQPDNGYTGLEYVAVNPYVLDTKTVNPSTGSQTVTSDEDGLSQVTVNPVTAAIDPDIIASNIKKDVDILGVVGTFEGGTLQSKTVDSSTVSQTITPDGANYGLSSVTVNPYTEETVSDTITQNGQYTYTAQSADTLSEVTIDVSVADIPAVIQTKSVTYTQNGEYTVTKDAGYDGMSSVDISVNIAVPQPVMQTKTVDSSTSSQTVTPDQNYDGLSSVTVNPYTLENKTVDSSTTQQTISADNGYDGLNMVTVNPYTLDSKTVDSSTVSQTVTSSQDGLSSVTVNPYTLDSKTVNSSTNPQTVTSDEDGLSSVTVNPYVLDTKTVDSSTVSQTVTSSQDGLSSVTVNPYVLDTKTVDSSTVSQTITSDEDGMSSVTVNPYVLDTKTVDSSTVSQTVTSSQDGLSSVTVNAVTSSIDPNIQAGNIKDGVTILGIAGSYVGQVINNQNKTVNSSTYSQTVTADASYTGLGTVTVNPYILDYKIVDASTSAVIVNPDQGHNGLSSVRIQPVTSHIDSNITAGNIKDGVTILGVTGTYSPQNVDRIIAARSRALTDLSDMELTTEYPYQYAGLLMRTPLVKGPTIADTSITAEGAYREAFYQADIQDVSVPNLRDVSADYCFKNAFGLQVNGIDHSPFTSLTALKGHHAMEYCFKNNLSLLTASFPNLASVTGVHAMDECFSSCYNLTSLSMPLLSYPQGAYAMAYLCLNCTGLTSIDLSALQTVEDPSCLYEAFGNCTSLTSVTLPNLRYVYAESALDSMFWKCSSLGSFSAPYWSQLEGKNAARAMLAETAITTLSIPWLQNVRGLNCMDRMCSSCLSLTTVNLPEFYVSSDTTDIGSPFVNCPNLTTFNLKPSAIQEAGTRNILHDVPTVTTITLENYFPTNKDFHLDWQPNLSAQSVYNILNQAQLISGSGKYIYFYTGGLTVTDFQDGRVQTAYNAAVNKGWTIQNLTILPYGS